MIDAPVVKRRGDSLRWVAVSIFVISSTLNYLDRALIATLAPLVMAEMHFNQIQFGYLISAFSIAYAASSLAAGWFLDRVGVTTGISAAVSWWSAAAVATGLVRGVSGLTICRAALGIGESAGVPAVGKLNGIYLKPEERALGAALNQIGLSVGLAIAPLCIGLAMARGWRMPFIVTGLLGFLWIPLWWFVQRRIAPAYEAGPEVVQRGEAQQRWSSLLLDRNLILLVIANVLWMGSYSLWSNWTTLYLMRVHGLTLGQTARYTWIPPLVSNLGGFFGGWLSLRWMRRRMDAIAARRKAVWVSAFGSCVSLLLMFSPGVQWTTVLISLSFFFALAGSVNIYALPIDIFGPARAGLTIAALTCAFGLMQTAISPLIGFLSDHRLYSQVVWIVTLPLLVSALVLNRLRTP
ncbi:MAG: major facilitator superfamily 1 [Bryobacterales bacterium]|nr:major facilitator superfamily 1 [Bryobacterales bacterium]